MSQYDYDEDVQLNGDILKKALDEIYQNEKAENDTVNQIRDSFNKTYDPSTPLEKVAPLIDEADKYTDMNALGVSGIFLSLALFFTFIMFAQYSEILSVIVVFGFVAMIIATSWLAGYASNKAKKARRDLTNLRMTYFDKSTLNKLYEERDKKKKVGSIILAASIFMAIVTLIITSLTFLSDFVMTPFFLFFAIGFFIKSRTSGRKETLKKLLDTLQN